MPAPKNYLDAGFSPLHARCLFLFDQLKEEHHVCGMDNLFSSVKFFREAYKGKNKVLCHGVTRKSGRGLPNCVIQEEVKNKKEQEKIRGTTKAAVLTDDPECPQMVAFSVYDTKPVHFLSMACTGLKWIEKKKKVFDKSVNKNVAMSFLRTEVTDTYNNGMNNVDIADQIRNTYRIDRWMRKRKWWWSIWMWGVQILLVNAYILYKSAHLQIWKTEKKKLLSQYDFRREIVLAWFGCNDKGNENKRQLATEDEGSNKTRRVTSLCSVTVPPSKGRRVNDTTLDPVKGDLSFRLDADFHYPVPHPEGKYPPCALCRWALQDDDSRDNRVRGASVSCCDKCNVSLCIRCFKPFHTITDVGKLRSEIKKNNKEKSK